MFNLGMGEITVILLLALIFLGPGKLPDLAAGLGKIIKEIRKATSDVKNEITLDDSFRKPFEELRDAVTLHPDELKRRDEVRKFHEEAARRAAEEAAAATAEGEAAAANVPPDGLASPVPTLGVSHPTVDELNKLTGGLPGPGVSAPLPPGPNDTIVQAAPPRGATLDDIPTPPPETTAPPPPPPRLPGRTPPVGTVARPDTLKGVKPIKPIAPIAPAAPAAAPPAPANGESPGANITQILKEEDLMPALSSGKPPPPPHLPGLRPAGAPRPGIVPPLPPNPLEKKKT